MIFLGLLLWPILEIWLAIAVIKEYGFVNAFFAWLFSAILGLGLFRSSSLRLTVGVAQAMRQGKPPELAAVDGALVGLAGGLFLLPGYISDLVAVALLIPPFRKLFAGRLLKAFAVRTGGFAGGFGRGSVNEAQAASRKSGRGETESFDASSAVIDVEAVVVDDPAPGSRPRNST